jgi:hypothetical protein
MSPIFIKASFPVSVVTYRCLLLCSLSGVVIASQPTSIGGFIYLALNLVSTCSVSTARKQLVTSSDQQDAAMPCGHGWL